MSRKARTAVVIVAFVVAVGASLEQPAPARANVISAACGVLGSIGPSWLGDACKTVTDPGKAIGLAKKVIGGLLGSAGKHVTSPSGAIGIAAIVAWAVGGAHFVLSETAKLVGQSSSPALTAAWFQSVYWRVAGVGALLTLPFLIAAALQALLRSDGSLLARAVFAYLPISFLITGVAAPVAMMLLGVTDWMGATVAQAAGDQGSHFLVESGVAVGALGVAVGSPFITFLIALLTAAAGLILWLELLVREAAVYVVVLMLPLVFAAMVWPARRIWATRSVEVLVALIVAKFAIVAVLALAAAALGHSGGSLIVRALAGVVLVVLGAFAPWVLLRLLPLAEVAAAAAGHVREHAQARLTGDAALAGRGVSTVNDNVAGLIARMQRFHEDATQSSGGDHRIPVPNDASPRPSTEAQDEFGDTEAAPAAESGRGNVPAGSVATDHSSSARASVATRSSTQDRDAPPATSPIDGIPRIEDASPRPPSQQTPLEPELQADDDDVGPGSKLPPEAPDEADGP